MSTNCINKLFLDQRYFADELKSEDCSFNVDQPNLNVECAPLLFREIKIDIEETVVASSIHNDPDLANVKTEEMEEIENPGELV